MQLTIVGWSGSFPGPESPASCYLIDTGDFRLVLDLGNGALGALQRYTGLAEVDAICLSHLHADHCLDMCGYSVFQNYHPAGGQPRIPVYGPPGTAERLSRALGSDHLGMAEAFGFTELAAGQVEIGPLRITTAHMNHPVETFGFRIEHGGQVLAYSADTGPCDELVDLARGADVLLSEASFTDGPGLPDDLHLTARQAGEHAARAGAGELVLTHLVPWNDRSASLQQASEAFTGPLRLATSGLRLLGDPRP
ncbi:MAG TPA: MBL fold metallo-hydrolase [Streptosporangiaceae bacterium]|nr:MBL fold metallo-hydrolase [Streptosporangiaceae bacterium]